jgi:hypothetical protein
MADQSVALQIKTPDMATPLREAQDYEVGQTNLAAGQTKLQMLNRENSGQDIQYRSQLIRDAAAHALDADSWDSAMNAAAQKGAPEASQYVGRYTPLLQQRLFDAYGGAPQGTPGGVGAAPSNAAATPTEALDRMYQNVPPAQIAQSLQKNNMILGVLATVKDQQSQDAAVQRLTAMGIPAAQFLGQNYNPLNIVNLYNQTQQRMAYLQNRVAGASTGAPNPQVKTDMQVVGGVGYDPYNAGKPLTPPVQKPVPDAFGPNGEPIFYTEQGGLVRPGSGTVGPDVAAARIDRTENATGDPNAKNPRSTATGNGQFIDSTWLDTVKEARPELAKSLNDKQLLALRSDPQFSADMTAALATKNAGALSDAKLPVTTASLALAHRFGMDGATKILNAAPNTPMEQLVSPDVLKANPELKGQTAGGVAQGLMRQVGNDPVTTDQQQIFHKGQFDKPQLVETDDGKGGTNRVLAQQNNRTGQWVTADDKRTPIDSTNMVIIPESMGAGGGGRFAGQVIRIMTSAKQATAELGNLVQLPLDSSSGWFMGAQNRTPTSIIGATKQVLAQKVTDQEVQDFNTSIVGMGKALASLESGGMQTNQALIGQFDRLALQTGDTNFTKMRKLATMRQDAENAIESVLTSPLLGKQQKEFAQGLIADLRNAVPFSPNDVTMLERSKKPGATMGDFAKSQGLAPQFVAGQTYTDAKGNTATYGGKDSSGKDVWK